MPRIKIVQPWTNGGTDYEVGQNLDLKYQKDCDELITKGIAEAATEVKSVEEVNELNAYNMEIAVKAATEKALASEPKIEKKIGQVVHERSDDNTEYFKKGGFNHVGEYLQAIAFAGRAAVHGGSISKTLTDWQAKAEVLRKQNQKTAGVLSVSDDASGGFLVPTEFRAQLLDVQLENPTVRQRAQFIPMQTNSLDIPACVSTDNQTSVYGGIIMYKTGEGSQMTGSKPAFGTVGLKLNELTGYTQMTDQLIEDSPISIEPLIGTKFAQALQFAEDGEFISGTGVGGPLGVLNAACKIEVSAEDGQAATTIVWDNIINMYSRLHPASMRNAVWMANSTCIPQLSKLSVDVGTGGSAVGMPAGGATAAPISTLLGRPIIYTEHCEALGTAGDLILCDWSQYLIGGKAGGGVRTATSEHLLFDYNRLAFKIVSRYDGQPWWSAALQPKNGDTLSPFVTLETRS